MMIRQRITAVLHPGTLVLALSIAGLLAGCAQTQDIKSESSESNKTEVVTQSMTSNSLTLNDILSAADLIGKTWEECGLQEEPGIDDIKVEGAFFWNFCKGFRLVQCGKRRKDPPPGPGKLLYERQLHR